ncbi:MAG: SpoIID/LytB domain-containing protein, partial [Elusimicrobia bacterium]|nr:SpoIID/LytB domain-containing protein [Elusimicrobiota bacterium]
RVDPRDPSSAEIIDPRGKRAGAFRKSVRLKQAGQERRTTIVERLTYAPGYAWGGTADRELRGEIEIALSTAQKSLIIVNYVNLEEYVYGVLNSEMPTHWPMEALKAQAVLARTQAVYRQRSLRPHRAYGYDLCDEQHCQVYGGVPAETKRAKSAVDDTRGQILAYNGNPAHTIFFSNCGGHTQSGKEVGWADVAYWQGVFDGKDSARAPDSPWKLKEWLKTEPAVYCNATKFIWSPEFRWTRVISADELESRVFRIKNIGRIRALVPLRRSRSGHLNAIRIQGTSGELVIDREHEIRRVLALGSLRSTLFVIETSYRNGRAQSFTLYGGGWGHGVGMCQAGAGGRAEQGALHQGILSHYYPGTKLATAGPVEPGKEGKRQ